MTGLTKSISIHSSVSLSGRARSGKDASADFIQEQLAVLTGAAPGRAFFADGLKRIAAHLFGWDGDKTVGGGGRALLQEIGTECGRSFEDTRWLQDVANLARWKAPKGALRTFMERRRLEDFLAATTFASYDGRCLADETTIGRWPTTLPQAVLSQHTAKVMSDLMGTALEEVSAAYAEATGRPLADAAENQMRPAGSAENFIACTVAKHFVRVAIAGFLLDPEKDMITEEKRLETRRLLFSLASVAFRYSPIKTFERAASLKAFDYLEPVKDFIPNFSSATSDKPRQVIITDCRFPNERDLAEENGCVLVRMWRPEADKNPMSHASESFIDDMRYDVVIENEGRNLGSLHEKCKTLIRMMRDNQLNRLRDSRHFAILTGGYLTVHPLSMQSKYFADLRRRAG